MERNVKASSLPFFGNCDGPLFLARIVLLAINLARPRSAAPPGAPTRPRPWYVRVYGSTGLHRISVVRASGGMFRRRVFDAFRKCEEELFFRRTILSLYTRVSDS